MESQHSKQLTFENMPSAIAKVAIEISIIKNQLDELKKSFEPKSPTEYLTRNEVAELLKCDISSVHNWTKKGKLRKHCIGDRVYYKRSEIEASLVEI